VLAGWCSGAVCSRQPVMRSMIDLVIVTTLRPREPLANQSAPEITTQRACSWCTRAGHNFSSQLPHRHRIGVASCTIIQHCHCHCHVVADPGTTSRRAVCFPAIVTIVYLTDPLGSSFWSSVHCPQTTEQDSDGLGIPQCKNRAPIICGKRWISTGFLSFARLGSRGSAIGCVSGCSAALDRSSSLP
jgi:hypothetical protein